MSVAKEIICAVKQPEFYVPRDYQTIGGMWTVDTWQKGNIRVQLMDEGYTTVVDAPGLVITTGYNGQEYERYDLGDETAAVALLESLKG